MTNDAPAQYEQYAIPEAEIQRLVEGAMPFIIKLAKTVASEVSKDFRRNYILRDDLVQEGVIGAIYAARRYDPSVGDFNTFCHLRAKGRMQDLLRRKNYRFFGDQSKMVSFSKAEDSLGLSVPPEVEVDQKKQFIEDSVHAVIAKLSPREAHVIREYYFSERRQTDIGKDLGVNNRTVSNVQKIALERLGNILKQNPMVRHA